MKTKTLALILGAVCATGIAGCKSDEKKQDMPYSYEEVQRTHQQKRVTLNIEASACNNRSTVLFFENWFAIECGEYSFRERRDSNSPLYNYDSLYIGNQQEYSATGNNKISTTLKYQGLPQEINSMYTDILESMGAAQAMELWETWLGEQEVTLETPKREYNFVLDTPASACNNSPQVNMYNELSIGNDGHIWGKHARIDINCGIFSFGKIRNYNVQTPTTASYLVIAGYPETAWFDYENGDGIIDYLETSFRPATNEQIAVYNIILESIGKDRIEAKWEEWKGIE